MPRHINRLRHPSYRNLQVYHELAYRRKTQVAVAKAFGLSQCRVSQIGRKVQAWVDSVVPPHHARRQPGLRLHIAIAQERIRLHDAYEPVLGMLLGSDGQPRYLRRKVAVLSSGAVSTIEISNNPDFRLFGEAVDIQARLAQLEAIANLGPFADLPRQVKESMACRDVPDISDAAPASTNTTNMIPAAGASATAANEMVGGGF